VRVTTPLLVPPRRRRGAETLERLATAAERLLETKSFDAIEVDEIVREASSSVGSFYARFPGKDALLPYLYERHDRRLRAELGALVADERWHELDLPSLTARVVAVLIRAYRRRRWLLRAVALYSRTHPEAIDTRTRRARSVLLATPVRLFMRHRRAIRHADPEAAVAFALFTAASVCREKILFAESPHAASLRLTDRRLERALTRLVLAYLRCR
jgi:AcrR family transcriptional regulator